MPYEIVRKFERTVAEWAGAEYGVAVESCSAAIFLSLLWVKEDDGELGTITLPHKTYPSVPCAVINAGGRVRFTPRQWSGVYSLDPYMVYDGALRLCMGMYQGGLHCLSFHNKKHLPIGRGGMILTDSKDAWRWLRYARYDGRDEVPLWQGAVKMVGWNMYMTPEQAARGLLILDGLPDSLPDLDWRKQSYPDLRRYPFYQSEYDIIKATIHDAKELLAIKNDEEVRRFSIASKEPIAFEDHVRWLQSTIVNPNVELYAIQSNGRLIGDLRFDVGDTVEVSIRLAKEYRSKGIGDGVLKEMVDKVQMRYGKHLTARVMTDNVRSLRLFLANGFKVYHCHNGIVHLNRGRNESNSSVGLQEP